jgi:hypothetical protein
MSLSLKAGSSRNHFPRKTLKYLQNPGEKTCFRRQNFEKRNLSLILWFWERSTPDSSQNLGQQKPTRTNSTFCKQRIRGDTWGYMEQGSRRLKNTWNPAAGGC